MIGPYIADDRELQRPAARRTLESVLFRAGGGHRWMLSGSMEAPKG